LIFKSSLNKVYSAAEIAMLIFHAVPNVAPFGIPNIVPRRMLGHLWLISDILFYIFLCRRFEESLGTKTQCYSNGGRQKNEKKNLNYKLVSKIASFAQLRVKQHEKGAQDQIEAPVGNQLKSTTAREESVLTSQQMATAMKMPNARIVMRSSTRMKKEIN
jgi:hypothetical protein